MNRSNYTDLRKLIMSLVESKNATMMSKRSMKLKRKRKTEMKMRGKRRKKKTRKRTTRSSKNLHMLRCKKGRRSTILEHTITMDHLLKKMYTGTSILLFVLFTNKGIDLLKVISIHSITVISRHTNISTKTITDRIGRFTTKRLRTSTAISTRSTITPSLSVNTVITTNMHVLPSL